jgi:hypothetical protein
MPLPNWAASFFLPFLLLLEECRILASCHRLPSLPTLNWGRAVAASFVLSPLCRGRGRNRPPDRSRPRRRPAGLIWFFSGRVCMAVSACFSPCCRLAFVSPHHVHGNMETWIVHSLTRRVLAETTHGAQVRHLGQRRCRVHGLLRQGAREQGRHGAAAAPAAQPQRPRPRPRARARGGANEESPPAVVVEAGDRRRPPRAAAAGAAPRAEPPANGEQRQRAVRPPEQVRAAAAVLPATATREPAAAAPSSPRRRRRPPAAAPPVRARARPRPRPPSSARAQAAPRGAGATGAVRLAAEQRPGEEP